MKSKQVQEMVSNIVNWWCDHESSTATLNISNIPESDLNNLAALILSQDDALAAEATGPDNPEWEKSMKPALVRTMASQKNGYSMEEFHDIWTSGIRAYLMPTIRELLSQRVDELNEFKRDKSCHLSLIWDRKSEKVVELRI